MNIDPSTFRQIKFMPPRLQPDRLLWRDSLIERTLRQCENRRLVVIEAQAGQGKSVFAAQVLHRAGFPFCWYQLGPEDRDPVSFLETLIQGLKEAFPAFNSPLLQRLIENEEIRLQETGRYSEILLKDLRKSLNTRICLVFDDAHLIEGAAYSCSLLNALISSSSKRIRFMLLTRRPLPLEPPSASPRQMLVLRNSDLRLSQSETADLFHTHLELPLSPDSIRQLHTATEGWLSGLLILGKSLSLADSPSGSPLELPADLRPEQILKFFEEEVFSALPDAVRMTMLRLCLLDEIPLGIAHEIGGGEAGPILKQLEQQNFFIRSLDSHDRLYAIHHLFRDFLRQHAPKELPPEEIIELLQRAGHWYFSQECPQEALNYFLRAEDFEMAQQVLHQIGLHLLTSNHIVSLCSALSKIPEDVILRNPWLSYFSGASRMDTRPQGALPWLEHAFSAFSAQKNSHGELLSSVHILFHHMTIGGNFNLLEMLQRAEHLFLSLQDDLSAHTRIWIFQILAGAFGFMGGDLEKMDHYASLSLREAETCGRENFVAGARVVRLYLHLLRADWRAFRQEIEDSLHLSFSPHVNSLFKLFLQGCRVNLLQREGDGINFSIQQEILTHAIQRDLAGQTLLSPWVHVWKMDLLFTTGDLDGTLDIAEKEVSPGSTGLSDHLQSLFYQYAAFARAMSGQEERALIDLLEAERRRESAGGEWFLLFKAAMSGATFLELSLKTRAATALEEAFRRSEHLGEHFIRCNLHGSMALFLLEEGERDTALSHLQKMLSTMKKQGYFYLMGMPSHRLRELLSIAVLHGVESAFAQSLARARFRKAIRPDGTWIPLLEIRSLGRLEIYQEGRCIATAADLSIAQRELLGLLHSSPDFSLRQEEVECALWPNIRPEKSRARFHTLLSRLRSTLDECLHSPLPEAKEYLSLNKGVVRLVNCWVDARDFRTHALQGLAHFRRGERWQAGLAFQRAFHWWEGGYRAQGGERGMEAQEEMGRLHSEAARAWGTLLAEQGRSPEGIAVLRRALAQDPTNDALVRLLYHLHVAAAQPVKAAEVLREYRNALRAEQYGEDEIEKALKSFWHPSQENP